MEKATKAWLKNVKDLLREKKLRDEAGVFTAEGSRIVKDAAAKGHNITSVLVSNSFLLNEENLSSHFEKKGTQVFETSDAEFDRISTLKHPEGILAVIKKKQHNLGFLLSLKSALIVLCDGVQDPGNLGAIIRNSAAFNADALLLTGKSADIYNPKVVRASSGTVLDIPIISCSYPDLDRLKDAGYRIFVSHVDRETGSKIQDIKKLPRLVILAFGSEGAGVSDKVCAHADKFFHVPISDRVESLNVTSALTVSLYALGWRNNE